MSVSNMRGKIILLIFFIGFVAVPANVHALRPSDEELFLVNDVIDFFIKEMVDYDNRVEAFVKKKFSSSVIKQRSFTKRIYVRLEDAVIVLRERKNYIYDKTDFRFTSGNNVELRITKIAESGKTPIIAISVRSLGGSVKYGDFNFSIEELRKTKSRSSAGVFDFAYRVYEILESESR